MTTEFVGMLVTIVVSSGVVAKIFANGKGSKKEIGKIKKDLKDVSNKYHAIMSDIRIVKDNVSSLTRAFNSITKIEVRANAVEKKEN